MNAEKKFTIDKSTWKLTKLGDLATEISSRVDNPAQSEYQRFVGLEHFESGDLKIKKWGTTDNLTSSAKAFQNGDILFARRNAYLRRASMVEFDGCCSGDAFVLRENHEMVVPGFLAFVLNSTALWDFANSNAAGTMSKRVKWRDLAEYEFLLPPKNQQPQLVELLWAIDEVVENCSQLYFKNLTLKNSVFEQSISFHANDNASNRQYVKTTIGEIADTSKYSCVGGPFGSNLSGGHYIDAPGVPVLRGNNLSGGETQFIDSGFVYVSEEKAKTLKQNMAYRGDVIVTQRGTLGQVGLIPGNSKFDRYVVSQSQMKLTVDRTKALPEFVYYYLLSNPARRHLNIVTISTGVPHINLSIFKAFPIVLPSLIEQRRIIQQLSVIEKSLKEQKWQISETKQIQKSLINQVF